MHPNMTHRRALAWDVDQFKWSDSAALLLTILFAIFMIIAVRFIPAPVKIVAADLARQVDLTPPPLVIEKPKPVEVKKEPEVADKPTPKQQQDSPKATTKPRAAEIPKPSGDSGKEGRAAEQIARDAARERARSAVADTGLANAVSGLNTYDVNTDSRDINFGAKTNSIGNEKFSAGEVKRAGSGTGSKGLGTGSGQFGSATGSDRTGSGSGSLTGKASKGVGTGAEIIGKGASSTANKADPSSKKRTDFQEVMERAKGRVNSAYKRALDADPTLEGAVGVKVLVSADGNVTSAVISKSIGNSELEAQILTIVRGLHFASGDYDPFPAVFTYNLFN